MYQYLRGIGSNRVEFLPCSLLYPKTMFYCFYVTRLTNLDVFHSSVELLLLLSLL